MAKLILISGEEEFLVDRCINEILQSNLFDKVHEFVFPDDEPGYLEEINSENLDGSPRAILIRKSKDIPQLPKNNDTVIFLAGSKKISDPRATYSYHFPKLKSFFDNNEILSWILQEGERYTIDLRRISVALFVNSGKSLRKLSSEIQKIAALVPPHSTVTPEEAMSVMCFSADLTPKEIIDAISISNTAKAIAFYEKLQENNDETGWIIAYMMRFVSNQLRSDFMLTSGLSEDRVASILNIHPFVYKKTFFSQRGKKSTEVLHQCFGELCDLDVLHKRGVPVDCSLQLIIKKLSGEAGDVRN